MEGVLIVGMGIPGSGKSSIFGALADLLKRQNKDTTLYREPEESEWTPAVSDRERSGYISALTWFRSIRVPMLFQADQDRKDGKIALVDSYYDKLIHLYFDHPNFEWLMPNNDPYRKCYQLLIEQDFELLPDASCVISITVDENRWGNLVKGRGRELDRKSDLLNFHHMQSEFLEVSKAYCLNHKIQHIQFNNNQDTLAAAAEALYLDLINYGVIK
jgi:thymidylate kinase